MRLSTIDYVLWFATPVLMTAIGVFMYRRRLHREFPFFFNYVFFVVLSFAVEFPLRNWPNFFYVYWTTSALSIIVSFAVLQEIFKDAFRPYEALRDLSVILFRWCALVILLVAGMWAITSWHADQIDNYYQCHLSGGSKYPHDAVWIGVLHAALQRISGDIATECSIWNFCRIWVLRGD